ncbi:thioesterase II family protein [Streptomyces sp. NPDC052023]|uniref:thioesterase II family protein n=1 Tax=Streptomyces sp. NPDC052023 TaxID=3365681 RepID=UPI0037D6F82F
MTVPTGLTSRWIRRHLPVGDPRIRLLCFPHAGGTASFFRSWPKHVPADVEVLSLRYPGREDRLNEPFIDTMEPLADAIAEALPPLLDRPLAFFGHSMGASIAHEVAVRLEARHGFTLHRLMVSARPAPQLLPAYDFDLGNDEALVADVRRLDKNSGAILDDPDLRELVLPAIRADYSLVRGYQPQDVRTVKSPIAAYVGDADPEVSTADVEGWNAVSAAGFRFRVFDGDHFYLVPHEKALVADVAEQLRQD